MKRDPQNPQSFILSTTHLYVPGSTPVAASLRTGGSLAKSHGGGGCCGSGPQSDPHGRGGSGPDQPSAGCCG